MPFFQTFPILNRQTFVWGSKVYRESATRSYRWFGLPNLSPYLAAQLAQFSVVYFQKGKPDWVMMERQPVPLLDLRFSVVSAKAEAACSCPNYVIQ